MDALRSMLVHLDGGTHAGHRLALARTLAAQHEAKLSALCSVLPVPSDLALEHAQRAKACFDHTDTGGGWPMQWEPPTDEQPIPAFARRALHADLVVLGQFDADDEGTSTVPRDFVESVIVASGTPALVVPRRQQPLERVDVVAVAWQPSRESARALAAALPLLQQAAEVHLVTWMDDAEDARQCQQDVVDHLRLHGVHEVDRHRADVPRDVGEALLTLAAGVGADLLVMGCYGHSPARELVLGGATRTVLHQMHLPVLMAR